MAFNEKGRGNLRELYESMGAPAIEKIIVEAIDKGEIKPDEFSFQELWKGCTNDAPFPRREDDMDAFIHEGRVLWGRDKREAIGTGSFEKITTALINKKVIEGYDSVDVIWPNLVTEVPGKLKKETIAGMTAQVFPQEVPEGKDYEGTGIEEKYVTIQTAKYGRYVEVTEEMVFFDQTGQVLTRAKEIGEGCAQHKEKLIVEGVQDINGNVWNPSDTAQAIYSNAATNHNGDNLAGNTAFDASGLAAVQKLAHNMVGDSVEQNYILINLIGKPLLVPVDLMEEAWELSNGPSNPETAERAPNYWRGKFVPYTSPYITAQSSSVWYWGDFKRDFWWMNIWPLQTFTAKAGNYREFEADIISRHKVRYYGGIGAVDYVHVFKAT